MPRGGAKPGERRGGRKKGTKNRAVDATARAIKEAERATRQAIQQAGAAVAGREAAQRFGDDTELTPLAYMLSVMRDPSVDGFRRDNAARACMQFCHPALKSIVVDQTLKVGLEAELQAILTRCNERESDDILALTGVAEQGMAPEQRLSHSGSARPGAAVQNERRTDGSLEAETLVESDPKGSPTRH